MKGGCFVVLLLLAAPVSSPAQGLGDAAARERQKRQQQAAPVPAKVFTDEDLAKAKQPQGDEADVTTGDAERAAGEPEAACWREVVRTEFYQGIPVQIKVKEFVESEEFRQDRQALADLEEQFRRTGLPPGWAREPWRPSLLPVDTAGGRVDSRVTRVRQRFFPT
jgi:hypothetical protein